MKIGGFFFPIQIQDLNSAYEKMGKSIFQEKVFHHTLFFIKEQFTWGHAERSAACSIAQRSVIKIRWFYSPAVLTLTENSDWNSRATKIPIADFFQHE